MPIFESFMRRPTEPIPAGLVSWIRTIRPMRDGFDGRSIMLGDIPAVRARVATISNFPDAQLRI
jgi:hypothetical protein